VVGFLSSYARISVEIVRVCANFRDSLCANRGRRRLILVGVATPYARPHRNFFILGFFVKVCANLGGNCQSMRKLHHGLCANRGRKRLILVGVATPYARPHIFSGMIEILGIYCEEAHKLHGSPAATVIIAGRLKTWIEFGQLQTVLSIYGLMAKTFQAK
jgi:hypothetical protein